MPNGVRDEKEPHVIRTDSIVTDASAKDLLSMYGLPARVRYCRKCVISNQRPNSAIEYSHTRETKKKTIHFDNKNICDACRVTEQKKTIDWAARQEQLRGLCDPLDDGEGAVLHDRVELALGEDADAHG